MANITLTRLNEELWTVDASTITATARMSAAECAENGVTRGTKVTAAGADDFVQESKLLIDAAVAGDTIGNVTEGTSVTAGPFTLLALTVDADAQVVAPVAGTYRMEVRGAVVNSDVSDCYPTLRFTVDGVGVGASIGPGVLAFGTDGGAVMYGADLGVRHQSLAAGAVVNVGVIVTPGGVAGDEITITSCQVILTRIGA